MVMFSGESATDNSGTTSPVTCNPASGTVFSDGDTTVTCSATDASGNTGTCSFTVTVQDTTPPVVTCPADITVANDDSETTAMVMFSGESATDNSGTTPPVTCNPASGTVFSDGDTTVTCSATDASGNTGTCSFTVTVQDNTPPIVTCPADMTVEYDNGGTTAVVSFSGESATDNSGTTPAVTCDPASDTLFSDPSTTVSCSAIDDAGKREHVVLQSLYKVTASRPMFSGESATDNSGTTSPVTCNPASGTVFSDGDTTVTCSATDASGNTGTCSFTVTVQDTTPPVVTCPADITVANDDGETTAMVMFSGESATDNSGTTPQVTCNPASGTVFSEGDTTVTCSATDASGNTGTCSFTVTVQDTTPPVVTCPADITVANDDGEATAMVMFSGESATDNSGTTSPVTCNPASGTVFSDGDTTVTCSATDASGNTGTCSFTVTVQDTTPPVVTCPADITVANDDGETTAMVMFSGESATDNSGTTSPVTCNPASGTVFSDGDTTVTCSATDASGNTGTCSFTVTVQDNTPPIVTCPADMTVEYDNGGTTAVVSFSGESATDNSGTTPAVTCDPASDTLFSDPSTTVSCSAIDDAGNEGSCTFTVTLQDTTPPVVTCPADITVANDDGEATAMVMFSGESATDNSGTTPPVTCNPASVQSLVMATRQFTCSATDASGNTGTCSFTVTVQDDGETTAMVMFSGESATDNSGTPPPVTCNPASGTVFSDGDTTVTCSATDASGNTGTCSFTVTVQDTTPPVVTCPADITVANDDGETTAMVMFSGESATDNSGTTSPVTCNPASGTVFSDGDTTVTCSATDASGNTGTCSFTVTVQDTTPPVVTCPADITVANDDGETTAMVMFSGESATDNSGTTSPVTCNPASGTVFSDGDTTVTCSATDALGNTGTCSFTVTVQDTTPPVVTCPADITVANDDGETTAMVMFSSESATDNSGTTPSVTCNPASGTVFSDGVTTVTCSATDASGNTGTCSFTVTVQDTTPPVVTCPADITVENAEGDTTAMVMFSGESATNNSGTTPPVTCNPASGTVFSDGDTTVTCSATDASGNTGSCSFTVTVQDTTPPVVTCQADITVANDDGETTAMVMFSGESATDNSGTTSPVTCNPASGTVFSDGDTTVTCSATDASGNTGTCSFTVTVQDTTPPVVTCPADIIVANDDGETTAMVMFSGESATDNSGTPPPVTCNPPSGTVFSDGDTTVTCSATDASGNTGTCSFTVTVQDTTPPVVTCPADITVANDDGETTAMVMFSGESATDNSGTTSPVTCNPASGTVFSDGDTTVTCSATDASGNTGTCSFTVTVQGEHNSFSCHVPADITVANDDGETTAMVMFSGESATDNSGTPPPVLAIQLPVQSLVMATRQSPAVLLTLQATREHVVLQSLYKVNTTPPVVTCPADITVANDDGEATAMVMFSGESATDNSGTTPPVTCNPASGTVFSDGDTTVTCSATDASGNTGTCSFTVTVQDTTPPVVTCPADITVANDDGETTAMVMFSGESATDNSGTTSPVTCNPASGTVFSDGDTTVTCSATDASGNTGTCSFTVTVQDTTPPVVTCPADITVANDDGETTAMVMFSGESATDNSGTPSPVTCNPASGTVFSDGDTTVTCSATDASGNTGTCSFTVTVQDTTPPVVTCPADITVANDDGETTAMVMFSGESPQTIQEQHHR
ncbi:hyalin-like [Ptychodera flava]|uniref:hyalin-like n=1 Tax=Ptychodera flava TaxID=63121 RepID=UPI003969FE8C